MFESHIHAHVASALKGLRATLVGLSARFFEQNRFDTPEIERKINGIGDSAANMMRVSASNVEARLEELAETGRNADQIKRLFQAEHGILRDLKQPDPLITAFLVMLGWLLECVFTAIGLFADGHVDLIPALGFAITFSTVNVGLGLAAGSCLRYVGYRSQNPVQLPRYKRTRQIALAGFLCILAVDVVMIFTGGRVRTTGGHDAIFDFSQTSFPATFGDGLALVIMIVAALSFGISVMKGRAGFSDPLPEYSDHAGRIDLGIDEEAEDIATSAQELVDEIYESAEEDILDLLDEVNDGVDLVKDTYAFEAEIQNAKDDTRVAAHQAWERDSFIQGKSVPRPSLNTDAFDALSIDLESLANDIPDQAVLDELRTAHADATARIGTAYAAYSANVRNVPLRSS